MSEKQLLITNDYLKNNDDVIAFSSNLMCKLDFFKQQLESFLSHQLPNQLVDFLEQQGIKYLKIYSRSNGSTKSYLTNNKWLTEGKECEILQIGSNGWKKGKIRLKVSLEFIPDEPEIKELESPLDDIRQSMN